MCFGGVYARGWGRSLRRGLLRRAGGEIHDSVLWYFAQCLIYAGSAVGIDVLIDERIRRHNQK